MTVRAKVVCVSKTDGMASFGTVYEEPDDRDTENMRFTKASPWGEINMGIDNPAALEQFEVGQEYYVDFSLARKTLK